MSKQSEDYEKISLDPKNEQLEWTVNTEEPKLKGEEEHVEMPPATSVEVLEKMEKTGTFKIFLRNFVWLQIFIFSTFFLYTQIFI